MFKRPIIGALRVFGKTAARKFPASEVKFDALTADPFFRAGFIGASAASKILLFFAFHYIISLIIFCICHKDTKSQRFTKIDVMCRFNRKGHKEFTGYTGKTLCPLWLKKIAHDTGFFVRLCAFASLWPFFDMKTKISATKTQNRKGSQRFFLCASLWLAFCP